MRRVLLGTVALLGAPCSLLAQVHSHVHSHRGPGPHFIDAFFVENAYLERKIRPDVLVGHGAEGTSTTAQVEVEWAVVPTRASLIVHAPWHFLDPAEGDSHSGIGDVSIGGKVALINDRSRFILAVGADLGLPTGDAEHGLGEDHASAAPFLLAWLPFGTERRWLLQTMAHLDVPLAGDESSHAELGTAVSWTSPLGLTPMLEGLVEFAPSGGDAHWSVAPGFRYELPRSWEIGATVRLGIGSHREEDYRVGIGLIHHFPLPEICPDEG